MANADTMANAVNANRLDRLDLRRRALRSVPDLGASEQLSSLDLSDNHLEGPLALPPLPRLVELRLANNALDAPTVQRASPLPAALRVLDLGSNRLSLLPPCVLRLGTLSVLKVDRQRLRSLPPQLSLLAELVELDAGFNELPTALELDRAGLPRLRRLVLRSNALGRRAGALALRAEQLPSLTELDLAGNGLRGSGPRRVLGSERRKGARRSQP